MSPARSRRGHEAGPGSFQSPVFFGIGIAIGIGIEPVFFLPQFSIPMPIPIPIPTRATKATGRVPRHSMSYRVDMLPLASCSVSGSQSGSGSNPFLPPSFLDSDADADPDPDPDARDKGSLPRLPP
jgi:hypothetical protein